MGIIEKGRGEMPETWCLLLFAAGAKCWKGFIVSLTFFFFKKKKEKKKRKCRNDLKWTPRKCISAMRRCVWTCGFKTTGLNTQSHKMQLRTRFIPQHNDGNQTIMQLIMNPSKVKWTLSRIPAPRMCAAADGRGMLKKLPSAFTGIRISSIQSSEAEAGLWFQLRWAGISS